MLVFYFRLSKNILGLFLIITIGFFVVSPVLAEELPSLFQAAPKGAPGASPFPASEDQMLASADFSLLSGEEAPDRMTATLPDRMVVMIRTKVIQRGKGDYSWFGKVEGVEFSDVILTVVQGVLVGHINVGGQVYSIDPKNGHFLITKNDDSLAAPPGDDTLIPPLPSGTPRKGRAALPAGPQGAANDGSLIDIMVLYTQAFDTKYGSSVAATIQAMVDVANAAYTNSGVNTQARLVHSELFTDSTVSETHSISTALTNLTNNSSAATLRNTYKADLVTLFRVYPGSGSCGVAWMMYRNGVNSAFSDYAFSVVHVRRQSEGHGTYCRDNTMVHEMGHNMGCAHDRANYTDCDESNPDTNCPAYSHSYGYGVDGTFGTIMSYLSPRIEYFSTPNKTYSGYPMGIAAGQSNAADCVSTFNNTAPVVAQFQLGTLSDSTAPTAVSVSINGGASSAASTSVTLSLSATDDGGVTGYYASENGTTPGASDSGWTAVSSASSYTADVSFTLSSGNGTKTVYAWFRDVSGNVSNRVSDTIDLSASESTAPTAVSVSIDGGAFSTTSTSVTLSLSATDDGGVTGYYASENGTTPGASDSGWTAVSSAGSYTADISFTLSSSTGTKTIYVWFKDAEGNVSSGASASIFYFIPSVPALTTGGMVLLAAGILMAGALRHRHGKRRSPVRYREAVPRLPLTRRC